VLTLASALRRGGFEPLLFDLDGFLRDFLITHADTREALAASVSALAAHDADLFGFGTICSSYPMTLRLAEQLHRLRPDAKIILGGPQASVVDVRTLEEFPFIHAVVRGEADEIVAEAFSQIAFGGKVGSPGVTYRAGDKVIRNPDSPAVLDLDRTPPPAFDLCQYRRHVKRLPIEMGRGCPFACTFCSTNDFFRRRFRLRSPGWVLAEMRRLETAYGTTDFDLVHDMFTVDRKRVVEFCRFLVANGSTYTWHCSARTDFVDRDLIQIMRDAGCRSLFFGVETGSARLQKIIGKDLDIRQSAEALELSKQVGIETTVSLIVGFPEETREDLDATGAFALTSARFDSARVQLGLLAPLAATPLYRKWRDQLTFDGLFAELSTQNLGLDEADSILIQKHPDLFSNFYGVPAGAGREYTSHFRWFLTYALERCRWLAVAFGTHRKSVTEVYDLWHSWLNGTPTRHYYLTPEFAEGLCRFSAEILPEDCLLIDPVPMMAAYYSAMHSVLKQVETSHRADQSSSPRVSSGVTLVEFPFRPAAVIEALRNQQKLDSNCVETSTVALRRKGDAIVDVREVTDIGVAVLRLCDGTNSLSAMTAHLHSICPDVPVAASEDFLFQSLRSLEAAGLIQILAPLESSALAASAAGAA
jgi:radical SAM superfamily enzyme YgiQ (UPF0313 family)